MTRTFLAALLIFVTAHVEAAGVPTMRVDYYHTGNATEERFSRSDGGRTVAVAGESRALSRRHQSGRVSVRGGRPRDGKGPVYEKALLGNSPYGNSVGAFEGANYEARGFYRPQADCIMFTRNTAGFCAVCRRGIQAILDLYSR